MGLRLGFYRVRHILREKCTRYFPVAALYKVGVKVGVIGLYTSYGRGAPGIFLESGCPRRALYLVPKLTY